MNMKERYERMMLRDGFDPDLEIGGAATPYAIGRIIVACIDEERREQAEAREMRRRQSMESPFQRYVNYQWQDMPRTPPDPPAPTPSPAPPAASPTPAQDREQVGPLPDDPPWLGMSAQDLTRPRR